MARWIVAALFILCTGCRHGVILPKRLPDGQGSYEKVDVPDSTRGSQRFIPASLLMSADLFAQAEACAVAINTSEFVGRGCGVTQGLLRGGQLASAGMAVLAVGISGRVQTEGPKRRWDMTALASTALLGALTGYDAWLNCGERTFVEKELSAQRLAKLNNAGRLASCGMQHVNYEKEAREARAALAKVESRDAPANVGVDKAIEALDKSGAPPEALREAARALAQDVQSKDAPAAMVPLLADVNAERKAAAKEVQEVAPLRALVCRDVEKASEGGTRSLLASDYMDAAHKELIECLTPRFTTFGTGSR